MFKLFHTPFSVQGTSSSPLFPISFLLCLAMESSFEVSQNASSEVQILEPVINPIGGSPHPSDGNGGANGASFSSDESSLATPDATTNPKRRRRAKRMPRVPYLDITILGYFWVRPDAGAFRSNFRTSESLKTIKTMLSLLVVL